METINVVLTGGQINDSDKDLDLFDGVEPTGKKVLADRAYSCDKIRTFLHSHGATRLHSRQG